MSEISELKNKTHNIPQNTNEYEIICIDITTEISTWD